MRIVVIIISTWLLFSACKNKKQVVVSSDTKYTCSMHPQVMKDEPGTCPICHMDLIPVHQMNSDTADQQTMAMDSSDKMNMSSGNSVMPNEIELSEEQIRLGNIHADTISASGFGSSTVLTGTINFNEKNIETISSRVNGRIEKLYYKNTGDFVGKGSKVYELYSEELNSAKQEYILLLQKKRSVGNAVIDFSQLLQAAKNKLVLWGMTSSQVKALEQSGKSSYTTTFYSNAGGYITSLNVSEGDYVMEGQSLLRLANTSSLWVEAQVYTTQLAQLNRSGSVTVRIPELSNQEIAGTIEFVNPEINSQTRINLLRVNIPNAGNQLKPGMAAYIVLNNSQKNVISLPIDAVIRTNNIAMVWVKTEKNKFRMKKVTTGMESGNQIEITYGLKEGDVVITSGAYLLNSEYLLRNGTNSMANMDM